MIERIYFITGFGGRIGSHGLLGPELVSIPL
jgi:hypothetical protein